MINKTKLETINEFVKTIENIDSIFTFGNREFYILHYNSGNTSDISAEIIDNALSAYKETLTSKLKQLGYEENYVEVTARG